MSFRTRTLLARNLRHFRAANLAVVAGVAVATAVLTGALLVGDSVRQSLRDLAVRRLGPIDHALVAPRPFPVTLANRLSQDEACARACEQVVPAILLDGGAARADETRRAPDVQIGAVGGGWVPVPRGRVVVNAELADALGIIAGDTILLSVPRHSPLPEEAIVARRSRGERLATLRVTVDRVEREGLAAEMSLDLTQRPRPRAWCNLEELQRVAGQPGQVNVLLASARPGHRLDPSALQAALRGVADLGDYGLSVAPAEPGHAMLRSRGTYLSPAVAEAVAGAADRLRVDPLEVFVHLARRVERVAQGEGAAIHYVVVAGVSDLPGGGSLADDEAAVNAWTAEQLGLAVGDVIAVDSYERAADGRLVAKRVPQTFRVARVLPMEGLGADPSLAPEYPGITDQPTIDQWDPPAELDIDRALVTPADEAYWERYRAAPKVFLGLRTAQRLWATPGGTLTGLRVPADEAEAFRSEVNARLDPAAMGLRFRPVRTEHLAAAQGSTDFSGLFLGLSFFLILAAVLLVALLLRLNVERRARQYGALIALGFTPRRLRRLAAAEGAILAGVGGAAGVVLAFGYTALMLLGLRTWWRGAVGTGALRLHGSVLTAAIGLAAGVGVALLAVVWGVWRLGRVRPVTLLAGSLPEPAATRGGGGRAAALIAGALAAGGGGLLIAGIAGAIEPQWAFLSAAALLLPAALAGAAWLLQARPARSGRAAGSLGRLALRNASRHRGRSVLTMGLLASATFILILTAAFRQGPPTDTHERRSGAGGYTLIVDAGIPLPAEPGTPDARRLMGFARPDDAIFDGIDFVALPRRPGQDVSCLNLNRPTSPAILAAPDPRRWEGRFSFARVLAPPADQAETIAANPWRWLDAELPDGAVPVIADDESARYILHLSPGDSLAVVDDLGQARELRLVATLRGSIFQGELLVGREAFRSLFPRQEGFGVVLVDAPPGRVPAVRAALAEGLADYGAAVEPTALRLARYLEVANTYLATFQALGFLGLMLGAVGLAVVLLRNLLERRAELALLAALGFSARRRLALLLIENGALLVVGLAIGLAIALLGVLPAGRGGLNWGAIALALGATLAIGLGVLTTTALLRGRTVRPTDLRAE